MTDPATRPIPRPARDTRIDVIRGWLQLSIFASHASGSFIGAWTIHAAWGLSDSSEQFIFLSGLMLGSVFARKSLREGFAAAARDMAVRTMSLYRTHAIVFALFALTIFAATWSGLFPGEVKRLGWTFMAEAPWRAIPASFTMLYEPNYMDILPMFIWSMIALPAFAWLDARIGAWSLTVPAAIYLFAWLGGGTRPQLGCGTDDGFNPLAWQILFMIGAFFGRRMLLNGRVLTPSRWIDSAAALTLAAGLILRLSFHGFLPFDPNESSREWIAAKEDLALPRLLHALALAWIVARIIPREAGWMHLAVFRWMAAAGRHSLHVFCLGLFLSWGATAAFRLWPGMASWLDAPLILGGCAILLWFGVWRDRERSKARQPRAIGPPAGSREAA